MCRLRLATLCAVKNGLATFPCWLSHCVCCLHSLMRTSARNASRRSRQRRSRLYLCSEWKSPRLCRLRGETAARRCSGWSGRLWPLLCYHLNRRSALESKWTFMPKREEIHPKWCGRTPGGLDKRGKADLWPAVITAQLIPAPRCVCGLSLCGSCIPPASQPQLSQGPCNGVL